MQVGNFSNLRLTFYSHQPSFSYPLHLSLSLSFPTSSFLLYLLLFPYFPPPPQSINQSSTHRLVRDPPAEDEVLVLAGLVVLVVDLLLLDRHVGEAAAAQGDPAARAVVPHHDLGPHPHQVVAAGRGKKKNQKLIVDFITSQSNGNGKLKYKLFPATTCDTHVYYKERVHS